MMKKKTKELKTKEDLTLRVQQFGLWTTYEEMHTSLKNMSSKKEKINALKLQINFRKKVLGQVHTDKTVFQFSANRRQLSVEQLAQNLSLLFSTGSSPQKLCLDNLQRDPELLIYRRIEHLFECGGEDVWFQGT